MTSLAGSRPFRRLTSSGPPHLSRMSLATQDCVLRSEALFLAMARSSANSCVDCTSTRHSLQSGRRCRFCAGLRRRIAEAKRWDSSKPKSLRGCPIISPELRTNAGSVAVATQVMVRELEKELAARRTREKSLSKATGIQLEHWLTALASRCGIKRRMFAGAATGLAMSFPGDARVELARILRNPSADGVVRWGPRWR